MKLLNISYFNLKSITALVLLTMSSISLAQLPSPNAEGVSTGHTHFNVPNVAKHREIWKLFGAEEKSSGRLRALRFPGMFILLTEREPTVSSGQTTANHIAFSVQSYDLYKAKLEAVGATYIIDNAEGGQILADLPDGVRVEFLVVEGQVEPIVFHHTHLAANDQEGLRDWYVEVFGAEIGERNGMPSAIIPGGRVDVISARGNELLPTQGTAIDHIGFEVADMDSFAAKMARMGIEFDRAPQRIDAINLTIAFITDPVGTYIEITEGFADIE